jgi:mono/diheme cytochrome c family protein
MQRIRGGPIQGMSLMRNRFVFALPVIVLVANTVWAQALINVSDDVQKGRHLAALVCSNCHVAEPDQSIDPILRPPAPSFESIARRTTTSADTIRTFLTATHRDMNNPDGMPNPELTDFQLRQVTAYLLSLAKPSETQVAKPSADQVNKPPAAQAGSCRKEIMRLELVLSQARANRQIVGSAPESSAARLHCQPTPRSVGQAALEAEKTIETALVLARKLETEGMDAVCTAMLKKVELPPGLR